MPVTNLALDRIISIDFDFSLNHIDEDFDADLYYKDVIGVTVNEGLRTQKITVWIDRSNAPYVITKPFHHSQKIESENENGGIVISLELKINNEFERMLLGFGDCLKVISPEGLRKRMKEKLERAWKIYQ